MKKIDRSKRTKAELLEEIKMLEASSRSTPAADPTAVTVAKERALVVRDTVGKLSVDNIVSKGAQFGLEVQRTVAGLTEQAVQKAEELKILQEAVELETAEIQRLYDLDVASAAIDALLLEHKDRRQQLEKEIADTRAVWAEEAATHAKTVAQRNADTEATRRREAAEYEYRTQQTRQAAADKFEFEANQAIRSQAEQAAAFQKSWQVRFDELAAAEAAIKNDRTRIAGIDDEIKAATEKAVAIATNALKSNLMHTFALEKKDLENRFALCDRSLQDAQQQNQRLVAEIARLNLALDAARAEVKDIAMKSVEGASGQTALAKVMEMTQRETNGHGTKAKA